MGSYLGETGLQPQEWTGCLRGVGGGGERPEDPGLGSRGTGAQGAQLRGQDTHSVHLLLTPSSGQGWGVGSDC